MWTLEQARRLGASEAELLRTYAGLRADENFPFPVVESLRRFGYDAQGLAREAIDRLVDDDDWFVCEVEKGLSQIDCGQTCSHEDVGARLEALNAGVSQQMSPPRTR